MTISYPFRVKAQKVGSIIQHGGIKRNDLSTEPKSIEDLVYRLRNNSITQLKVGWNGSNFLRTKKHVLLLEKALKQNWSLNAVSIGWHIRDRAILCRLCNVLAKHCKIQHIRMVLLEVWLPETVIRNLLASQTDLLSIDMRSVHVRRRNPVSGRVCCEEMEKYPNVDDLEGEGSKICPVCAPFVKRNDTTTSKSTPKSNVIYWRRNNKKITSTHLIMQNYMHLLPTPCDHCVVSRVISNLNYHYNLNKLCLADCNVTDKTAIVLADFISNRGGISELSLRMNVNIGANGLKAICQSPVYNTLDLSLCDIQQSQAIAIAEGIAARQYHLGSLILCGNYQIGLFGLISLVQPNVCQKLVAINISYCEIDSYRAYTILRELQASSSLQPSMLREVFMQGAHVGHSMVSNAMSHLLETSSSSLRVLKLDDPADPCKVMNADQLRTVLHGLRNNFEMEDLGINYIKILTPEREVWKEIMFHLELNRAGRRILIQNKPLSPSGCNCSVKLLLPSSTSRRRHAGFSPLVKPDDNDWFDVLANAGKNEDLSVTYWMVRHGAHNFSRQKV